MTFELHPGAEKDIAQAMDFYLEEAGAAVAGRFLDEFYRVAKFLVDNPEVVSASDNGHRTFPFHIFPYSVVYVTVGGTVRILVVRHQRRKPGFGSHRR